MPGNRNGSRDLGPYELLETLGSGSSAKVYRAREKFLGREVAMKVLHEPLLDEQAERFLDEARIVAHLEHPNIVRVLGFNIEQSIPYLVMEYAPQGSLRQRHPVGTRLPLPVVVSYVKQAASGLQYAHDRGETHLDIKPENMLLGKHEEILLSDFGIAGNIQLLHPQMRRSAVGTVPYMAPEQIRGRPGKATDQYALAAVVYEWLVGIYPFMGIREEIARQHLYDDPPSLCDRNPMVPPEVEGVIMKALSKDPEHRYSDISAFASALEKASNPAPHDQQAGPPSPSHTGRQAKKQDAFLPISCLTVALLLLLFIAWVAVAAIAYPASITITPVSKQLAQNETLVAIPDHSDPTHQQVQARLIANTPSPLSKTVKATGVGQDPGKQAQGYLTFYNSLPVPQTVPQGTAITEQGGITVVTGIAATIPPANPPASFGAVTIPAHARLTGPNGNIPGGAINGACCSGDSSISVKNLTPFSGGEDPQPYTYVQQSDINGAATALEPALQTTAQQSLQKQIHTNEASAGPMRCANQVYSNYAVTTRTATVQVTVKLYCTEEVYDKAEAEQFFRLQLKKEANRRFGTDYALSGMIAVHVLQSVIKGDPGGSIVLFAHVSGIWVYQFKNSQKSFLSLINGKKAKNAQMLLLEQPGVSKVDIQEPFWVPWFIQDIRPINADHVTLNIME